MNKLRNYVAGAAVGLIGAIVAAQPASAVPANGSFGFTPIGTILVDTTDISLATELKILPTTIVVNTVIDPFLGNPNNLGQTAGDPLSFEDLDLIVAGFEVPVPSGIGNLEAVDIVVLTSNGLQFTFTTGETNARVASGAGMAGSFAAEYFGTLTFDAGGILDVGTPVVHNPAPSRPSVRR